VERIEPALVGYLLHLAKLYGEAKGIALSTVSRRAHSDPQVFAKIAKGEASLTLRKFDEAVAWFKKNWPDELNWPGEPRFSGIAKPDDLQDRDLGRRPSRRADRAVRSGADAARRFSS